MAENKEMVMSEFCGTIRNSWTYKRMTEHEQAQCIAAIQWVNDQGLLRGNFNTRWGILQAVYHAFLFGLGYDSFGWREPEEPMYDQRYYNPSDDKREYKWGEEV